MTTELQAFDAELTALRIENKQLRAALQEIASLFDSQPGKQLRAALQEIASLFDSQPGASYMAREALKSIDGTRKT